MRPNPVCPCAARLSRLNPESAELWTAEAEVDLRAGLPAEALSALDRAVRLPGHSLTAYALLVPAHLARGDAASAWDGLRAATSESPSTIDEVRSLAQAHLRLGEWQAALNTIEDYGHVSGDAAASIETCETLLRMVDAQWLYGETAGAHRHAPASSREDLLNRTKELLDGPLGNSSAPRCSLISSSLGKLVQRQRRILPGAPERLRGVRQPTARVGRSDDRASSLRQAQGCLPGRPAVAVQPCGGFLAPYAGRPVPSQHGKP